MRVSLATIENTKKSELEALSDEELLAFIAALVSNAKDKGIKVGPLDNKRFLRLSKNDDDDDVDDKVIKDIRARIINQAVLLIKNLREKLAQEQGGQLAIDRKFDDVKAQMNAIVDDWNSGRMPLNMGYRVVDVNFFSLEHLELPDGSKVTLVESKTFLAHALPKIKDIHDFWNFCEISLEFLNLKVILQHQTIFQDQIKKLISLIYIAKT